MRHLLFDIPSPDTAATVLAPRLVAHPAPLVPALARDVVAPPHHRPPLVPAHRRACLTADVHLHWNLALWALGKRSGGEEQRKRGREEERKSETLRRPG